MTEKRPRSASVSHRTRRDALSNAFSAFPAEVAAALRAQAVHRCWSNGSMVLAKGRVVPWVMTILQGRLRIAATSDEGHMVFFRWQMPGETVGLASAVSGLPLPVDIEAFEDCETLHVDREAVLELMHSNAEVACAAARQVAAHAYDLVHHLTARTEQHLAARVLHVLRHLAVLNGVPAGGSAWRLAISQQEVADAVGASRQRVNVELRALEEAGSIELGYRHVVVFGVVAR